MPRILVVDDEPDICQMIRRYAEHDGFETVGVSDGTEAVSICRKQDFDIIIMDAMMPEMDAALVERLFMRPFDTLEQAYTAAGSRLGKDASVIVMPYGGSTLPKLI